MANYYKVLGISRTATQDDIKRSYKKLVLQHHPDKGGDIEYFRLIQEAYEVLSNQNNRDNYNSSHESVKMNNTVYKIKISLREIYTGCKKTIKINTKYVCDNCKEDCNTCEGIGYKNIVARLGPFIHTQKMGCSSCNTIGIRIIKKPNCNCENGYKTVEKIIQFSIEKGDYREKRYEVSGLGEQPKRDWDIPGDVIIEFDIENKDNLFTRHNLDLIMVKQIKFTDAITGCIVDIPHYTKELKIDIGKVFGIINPRNDYIIKGEGIKNEEGDGNLIIKFEILYPEKVQYVSDSSSEILKNILNKIEWN